MVTTVCARGDRQLLVEQLAGKQVRLRVDHDERAGGNSLVGR
ncbi:hypothetical protein [Kitasatospora sp. KL5]